jgi:hypothetical protein
VKNDRYLGVAFKPGMGMDLSESRICEWRCFDSTDTMNNLYANSGLKPKYIIADIDTYKKGPEDDTYANFPVNYLKIARTPGPDDDVSPMLNALRDGNFFATTGEILITNDAVAGSGPQRSIGPMSNGRSRCHHRSRMGRRQEDRSSGDVGHRPRRLRHQALLDSVRRDRQSLGPVRGVGFGGQRRVRAAGLAERGEDDHQFAIIPRRTAQIGLRMTF